VREEREGGQRSKTLRELALGNHLRLLFHPLCQMHDKCGTVASAHNKVWQHLKRTLVLVERWHMAAVGEALEPDEARGQRCGDRLRIGDRHRRIVVASRDPRQAAPRREGGAKIELPLFVA
jgi:hypothetical protein